MGKLKQQPAKAKRRRIRRATTAKRQSPLKFTRVVHPVRSKGCGAEAFDEQRKGRPKRGGLPPLETDPTMSATAEPYGAWSISRGDRRSDLS